MLDEYKEILNTKQVCEILGISRCTLLRYLKEGTITGFKLGKKKIWRIKKKDLEAFINKG